MNILILGIGGPTPRSIAKHIRSLYPDARIVGTDIKSHAIGFFIADLIDKHYVIPRADDVDYWTTLKNIINKESIDLAFVQPEKEVLAWSKYYEKNNSYPCRTIMPPRAHVENLMDKAAMSDLLAKTNYIPKTLRISPTALSLKEVKDTIGYPCWIRASIGSGGLGSLKLNSEKELKAWLFIHGDIPEFTISEYLSGRHLANQMLYVDGKCMRNAGLHCKEYVMADIAPSKVTGNTSLGVLINESKLLDFCEEVMDYIQLETKQNCNGVYSFDLKEDADGKLKVTEINIRHMAYTGIMAEVGFDLIKDTVEYLMGDYTPPPSSHHQFDKEYVFLRDVDIEPIILEGK